MKNIIQELCNEVDKTLTTKVDSPRLRELAVGIIAEPQDLPPKFVSMAGDIHEIDTDTEPDNSKAKEYNLLTFNEFLGRLQQIKEQNIEFWSVTNNS